MNLTREDLECLVNDPNSFLSQGTETIKTIENIQTKIEDWRDFAMSVTAPSHNNNAPNSNRNVTSRVEKSVLEIIELEEERAKEFAKALEASIMAKWLFNNWLTDMRHKLIFEYYYINGLTLETVMCKTSYSKREVAYLKAQGLEIIRKKASYLLK